MDQEAPIALAEDGADGELAIRVNFGVLAGRPATPAELEELGHALVAEVGEVTVVGEDRHELSDRSEAELHQVRVELAERSVDEALRARLLEITERWARACAAERHADVTDI